MHTFQACFNYIGNYFMQLHYAVVTDRKKCSLKKINSSKHSLARSWICKMVKAWHGPHLFSSSFRLNFCASHLLLGTTWKFDTWKNRNSNRGRGRCTVTPLWKDMRSRYARLRRGPSIRMWQIGVWKPRHVASTTIGISQIRLFPRGGRHYAANTVKSIPIFHPHSNEWLLL